MKPTLFIVVRNQAYTTGNDIGLGPVVSWYKSILLNRERPFEAIEEEEWPVWLVSSHDGYATSTTAMTWNDDPLFGGRLLSPQERRIEMIEHVIAQATNTVVIGLRGVWPDGPIESFLTIDRSESPVALSVNVKVNVDHFSDFPDFHCQLMFLDHFNSVARSQRKGHSHGMLRKRQAIEQSLVSEAQRLAESLSIGQGQYLPIAVVSGAREIAGVLRIDSLEQKIASSTVFLVDRNVEIKKGTILTRSASVKCNAKTRSSTRVVGSII